MGRRSGSGRSRRSGLRSSRNSRDVNVYFMEKGGIARYPVVPDIGPKGVNSPKEVRLLAAAQLADTIDGKTVDRKTGRTKPFKLGTWFGRMKVLWKLWIITGRDRTLKEQLRKVHRTGDDIIKTRSKEKRVKKVWKILTEDLGLSEKQAKEIILKTNPKDKTVARLVKELD